MLGGTGTHITHVDCFTARKMRSGDFAPADPHDAFRWSRDASDDVSDDATEDVPDDAS